MTVKVTKKKATSKKKTSTRKKPSSTSHQFKKGNTAASAKKLTPEQKTLKAIGKTKAIDHLFNALFNPKVNVDEIAHDQTRTPAERGFAKLAIGFMEKGDIKDAEFICGVFGIATKTTETKMELKGTYTDFLKGLDSEPSQD